MRRCLDCARLIHTGSRCPTCVARRRSSWSRTHWARLIKTRDGYRCVKCGSGDRVEAHHVIPLARGGLDSAANGVTLCHGCHVAITEGRASL